MHYYKKNIGDYHKKAGRLSMLQHGAYTLLIDSCYDREVFPTFDEAIDWVWASNSEEVDAVKFVLGKFFKLQDDGRYIQPRIADELEKYKISGVINQLIALSREAKKKKQAEFAKACDELREELKLEIKNDSLTKTHEAWSSVVESLIKSHESAPNQEPINQEPLTTNQEPINQLLKDTGDNAQADTPKEKTKSNSKRFTPPTILEVNTYKFERNSSVDSQRFIDHYTSNGWMVGKNKMKDWKAAFRNWESGDKARSGSSSNNFGKKSNSTRDMSLDEQLNDRSWGMGALEPEEDEISDCENGGQLLLDQPLETMPDFPIRD